MMKRFAVAVTVILAVACGGGSKGTPTQPQPPPPQFTSLIGNWGGTLVIVATVGTVSGSNTCTHTWIITSQTQGQFSGTFQLSGGTTAVCAQSGNVSGTIGTDNSISNVTYSITVGPATGCTRTSGDGVFRGQFSGGTLSATTTEGLTCSGVAGSRNITINMTR